jgi:hypothetical protein
MSNFSSAYFILENNELIPVVFRVGGKIKNCRQICNDILNNLGDKKLVFFLNVYRNRHEDNMKASGF